MLIGWAVGLLLVLIAPVCLADGPSRATLPNGLRIAMFPDADDDADGVVQLWLQIRAGSISERDEERGSAMLLKRALMFGTSTMDEDAVSELFSLSGMDSSIGRGAFTHFDQTTYTLSAPDNETLGRVLGFYRDLLESPQIGEPEFARARGGLLSYIEQGSGNPMRGWMPEILADVPVGNRLPLAQADALMRLTPERVNGFAERTYTPANATLIVVGPFDPDTMARQIGRSLGAIHARGGAVSLPEGHGPAAVGRIASLESAQDRTDVALVWFEQSRFADTDAETSMRRLVLEKVAAELVRHRVNAQVFRTLEGVVETDGSIVNLYSSIRAAQVVAAIKPGAEGAWEEALGALLGEINRLGQDPIGVEEFIRARRACLLQWRGDQDEWSELSAYERARACNWIVNAGLTFDPARWCNDASTVLSTITNEQIHSTIRRVFDPNKSNLIIMANQDPVPGLEAARAAFDSGRALRPEPLAINWVSTGVPPILASIPSRGEIREISQHAGSGVWTARMSNGVTVRQRTMGEHSTTSELRVSLQRVIDDRTLEEAAISGWHNPSTTKLNASEVRSILNAYGLTLEVLSEPATIQLVLRASEGQLDRAIELAYVLLSDAEVDAHAFTRWRQSAQEHADEQPGLLETAFDAFIGTHPRDPALCSPIGSVTLAQASRTLHEFARSAPMEISIVGPSESEGVLEKAQTLFGSLPARPVTTTCSAPEQTGDAMEPECLLRIDAPDPAHAGTLVGLVACESTDLPRLRAMILTSMILNSRITRASEEGKLPADAYARIAFDDRMPGRAILLIESPGHNTAEMGDTLERLLGELAMTPPSAEEVGAQAELIHRILDTQIQTTRFWAQRLADLGSRGYSPEDIWRIREAYLGMTPSELHRQFAACYAQGRHIRVEVVNN